jgi:putative acetyltransferase
MYTLSTPGKSDYPALLAIWEDSVRATHHFLQEEDIEFFKNTIQEQYLFDHLELTLARDSEGTILGFIAVSKESLEMIFLAPRARGRGIGKMLLRHAIDEMKITKVDVNEQNEEALQFYKHFGFEVVSRSKYDNTGKPYPILHMQLLV